MKKVLFSILCITIGSVAVNAQDNKNNPPPAHTTVPPPGVQNNASAGSTVPAPVDPDAGKFKFKEETHDYGEVPEGPLAEFDFEFKNVGKKPIIISEAHGSCGCTVPKWPTDPILPKQKGVIHVSYNTNGRVGVFNKDVYITSNAQPSPMKLHITGTVKAKAGVDKPATLPPPPPPGTKNKQ